MQLVSARKMFIFINHQQKLIEVQVTQITYAKGGRCRSRLCVVVGALCCGWTVLCEGVDGAGLIAILILRRLSGLQELQKKLKPWVHLSR